eukprot:gene27124-32768_t
MVSAGTAAHAAAVKKNQLPETVTGAAGSAKRNIIRRGGPGRVRKEGLAGQMVDDGSTYEDPFYLDQEDPNFDSEEEDGREKIPRSYIAGRMQIGQSKLTLTAYKKAVQPVIKEYFASGDIADVVTSLEEIGAPEYSYEFVKRLVNASIDLGDAQREMTSRLLSELYPNVLSMNMIGKGFERLFEIADEIEIDVPQAAEQLAAFVARAVVDEVLPPSFLTDAVVCNLGGDIIDRAKLLLSREHGGAKLERIWGPGDGRPVEDMKVAVDQLLLEYLASSDLDEAERCVRELQSPHFYHEIVKRAVTIAMEKCGTDQERVSLLLQHLARTQLLSQNQVEIGFNRLYAALPDLVLDTPLAGEILEGFRRRAVEDGTLPAKFSPPS